MESVYTKKYQKEIKDYSFYKKLFLILGIALSALTFILFFVSIFLLMSEWLKLNPDVINASTPTEINLSQALIVYCILVILSISLHAIGAGSIALSLAVFSRKEKKAERLLIEEEACSVNGEVVESK